jgi:hypothetical protein
MDDEGTVFKYSGKTYQFIESLGVTAVYQKKKKGLEPVHGIMAFRIISAYKKKVKGEVHVRRPRLYARKARRKLGL